MNPVAAPPPAVTGLGRVFVLDDDRDCLKATAAALTQAGFQVEAFSRAEDFYGSFSEQLPAAVVIDRQVEKGSGILVAAKLRSQLGARRPAVVIWTADPRRDGEATLLSDLADDVVIKGEQALEALVQRVINCARWDRVGPGLYCRIREGVLLYKGLRSDPLTPRELDFAYCLASSGGITRTQARLLLLDLEDKTSADVHVNVVVSRFRRKLPESLRSALRTERGHGWRFDLSR